MTAPRNHSRASTPASQDSVSNQQNAALLGAATAFGRPASKAKGPVNTYTGKNTALAAATTVGSGSSSNPSPAPPLFPNSTGGSVQGVKSYGGRDASSLMSNPTQNLGLPPQPHRENARSPSQQAAFLAAARAPPPTDTNVESRTVRPRVQTSRRPAVAAKPRRLSGQSSQSRQNDTEEPTDSSPILPTTSLVDLYERKENSSHPSGKRPEPIVIKPSSELTIKSPKPVRSSGGITSMFQLELDKAEQTPKPAVDDMTRDSDDMPTIFASRTLSKGSYASASEDPAASSSPVPAKPRLSLDESHIDRSSSQDQNPIPGAITIPRAFTGNAITRPKTFSPSSASMKSLPAQYHQLYPRKITPSRTGDSTVDASHLADAMVAGSLASSRAPSPHKDQPPPPPTRRHKHRSILSFSRTPSPTKKGMRQTLRKVESEGSEDEDDGKLHPYGKHKKKRHLRKHPNKHHEGDRKRWRDAVTERERKRYEGVWAANKDSADDQVSNIIVRDLWNRSRLPENTLEVIWDLVDHAGLGRLTKEEFVVGMWLIDQRLKGRKLPQKVGDSVWESVKRLQGIKIRK